MQSVALRVSVLHLIRSTISLFQDIAHFKSFALASILKCQSATKV